MRTQIPPEALARDERFNRITTADRFADQRPNGAGDDRRMDPASAECADRARRQMHGIFVGEIQALEGAGRTAFDYTTDETPFAMKLDMARQAATEGVLSLRQAAWSKVKLGLTSIEEALAHTHA